MRYLSANSGGAWYAGAFSYSSQSTASFVGDYLPPQNLTLRVARAGTGAGTFLNVLARANLANLLSYNPRENRKAGEGRDPGRHARDTLTNA